MQPLPHLPVALLVGLALACSSTDSSHDQNNAQSSGEAQAQRVQQAKEQARLDAIADLYEQWRYDYVTYRKAVTDALAIGAAPAAPVESVRSVDELLRESDPEGHDPEAQALRAEWLAASEQYDLRLRQLANDPELDPRSPLKPEVRDALVPTPTPR